MSSTGNHTSDLIFMFGPPLFNKLSYLPESLLRQDHVKITLKKVFEDNPAFGLRDVSLQIVSELKKDKQIVIEDEFCAASTRKSILSTIKKKVSSCRVLLARIIPDYGQFQVLWTHQNAHGRGLLPNCYCQAENVNVKRWFDSSMLTFDYQSGFVDAPEEREGFTIKDVHAPFLLQTRFKCEVPALFIQWEAAISDSDDFNTDLTAICQRWTASNEHGRLIIIGDGKKDCKLKGKENIDVQQLLKELLIKINRPIYVMRTGKGSQTNDFCVPPQPGLLAFLQTRHYIDLQAKHTVYIFETTDHMKMAQAAGVKFVKSSKVYRYPEKTISSLCVIPPVPVMLKDVSNVESCASIIPDTAHFPLLDQCVASGEGFASQTYHNGLEESVFLADVTQVLKLQESFARDVTPSGMPGSKMRTKKDDIISCTSRSEERSTDECKRDRSLKQLPVWMSRKLKRKSTESSLSGVESDELESSFKFTKTVYLMSERELKEMAIQVMKQAGKTVQEEPVDDNISPNSGVR